VRTTSFFLERFIMCEFKVYKRVGEVKARHLRDGETLASLLEQNISVSAADKQQFDNLPLGMVAQNPKDPTDQLYIAHAFFTNNYTAAQACDSDCSTCPGGAQAFPDYMQRVIVEASQNKERLEKLRKFTLTSAFNKTLDEREQTLLFEQQETMAKLQDILENRIGYFQTKQVVASKQSRIDFSEHQST
jgi:hypothetical protein